MTGLSWPRGRTGRQAGSRRGRGRRARRRRACLPDHLPRRAAYRWLRRQSSLPASVRSGLGLG